MEYVYQCTYVSLDTGEKSHSTIDLQPIAPLPPILKAGQLYTWCPALVYVIMSVYNIIWWSGFPFWILLVSKLFLARAVYPQGPCIAYFHAVFVYTLSLLGISFPVSYIHIAKWPDTKSVNYTVFPTFYWRLKTPHLHQQYNGLEVSCCCTKYRLDSSSPVCTTCFDDMISHYS